MVENKDREDKVSIRNDDACRDAGQNRQRHTAPVERGGFSGNQNI